MKISGINNILTFKSIRTDKNTISTLKNGNLPIIENQKVNILTALNNLQNDPTRNNIEFLIDIADNLTYGQGENSEFKTILDLEGITPPERENTPWSKILEDTIKKALETSNEDTDDLKEVSEKIFNTKKELTEQQKSLLESRKELTALILKNNIDNDAETITRAARIRQNIDYFIASSEIPFSQKEECLNKFKSLLNGDYEITPQLEDKRLQVADEMLNDMLIKTPANDVLTIKDVNQRHSGICAAISICRKALAYEDKTKYMDTVMDELSASPYMTVYDITELGTGKKITIDKINIDYDRALEEGYRIIDASAHNWMQNAHTAGDGTIVNEQFEVFDRDTYGINHDTSWYEGLDDSLSKQKTLLKYLIQENRFLEGIEKRKEAIKETHTNIASIKEEAIETQTKVNGQLHAIFAQIYPDKSKG